MLARRCLSGLLSLGLTVSLMSLTCCDSPSLVAITITPNTQFFSFNPGLTSQFTATGIFDQGNHPKTTQDITNEVTWKSSAAQIATISSTGLVTSTGVAYGTSNITASMNGFTGLITANATVQVCLPGQTVSGGSCK